MSGRFHSWAVLGLSLCYALRDTPSDVRAICNLYRIPTGECSQNIGWVDVLSNDICAC